MNKPDFMDEMMRTYFSRQEESFTYRKREHKSVRVTVLVIALLVIVSIITLSLNTKKQTASETLSNASQNSVNIATVTAIMSKPLSSSPHNGTQNPTDTPSGGPAHRIGVFVVDGENICSIKSRSLYQNASFFRIRNSDFQHNHRLEWDAYIDTSDQELLIPEPDTNESADEEGYYEWRISGDTKQSVAIAYSPTSNLNDVVETQVNFDDGTRIVKIYNISYEGSEMIISDEYNSRGVVYGWDLNSDVIN